MRPGQGYFLDKNPKYDLLQDQGASDDIEHSIDSEMPDLNIPNSRIPGKAWVLVCLSTIMLLLSVLFFVAAWTRTPGELECAKVVSPYSPAWEAIEFYEGDFDNPFTHPSIYRGLPTPEREEAWEKLWLHKSIGVSAAGIAALNKTHLGPHVEVVKLYKGEETKYGAILEVFHQLHCLNAIRQFTWLSHYHQNDSLLPYPPGLLEPVGARMHVDHCLESLRLSLMCYGDITPVLVQADDTIRIGRKADFSVHHKCRNFEQIVNWAEENARNLVPSKGNQRQ